MKVKLLVPIASATGAYGRDEEYTCASADEAQRMIEAGMAEVIRTQKVEKAVKRSKSEKAAK